MNVYTCRTFGVGQDRVHAPHKTVYLVISLPKISCIRRINMVLANPTHTSCAGSVNVVSASAALGHSNRVCMSCSQTHTPLANPYLVHKHTLLWPILILFINTHSSGQPLSCTSKHTPLADPYLVHKHILLWPTLILYVKTHSSGQPLSCTSKHTPLANPYLVHKHIHSFG